jgi:hypothetical protein
MKFNMNHVVRVKLTPKGRDQLKADHIKRLDPLGLLTKFPYQPPEEDADGWSRWQLWVLMEKFGEHMGLGRELLFDAEIDIPEQQNP